MTTGIRVAARVQAGLSSVVIVTADSGGIVHDCVARVLASDVDVEVVLVDNASTDGVVDRVCGRHADDPRLRVLRNAENLGFGRACNLGAAIARGDALLFLNPDCLVAEDTLAHLRDIAVAHPEAGLVGVRVTDRDGRLERAARRREPTLRRALMALSGLSRFESRLPALAGIDMPSASTPVGIEQVEAVSGACLYLPRQAFESVGGFDEAYFLHCEDLDLFRRLRDSGRSVLFAGNLSVRHEQGSSSRHRPAFVARHKHRSMWRYFTRFDPSARNPLLRGLVWLGIWCHYYALAPLRACAQRTPAPTKPT